MKPWLSIDDIPEKIEIHEKVEFVTDKEVEDINLDSVGGLKQLLALFYGDSWRDSSNDTEKVDEILNQAIGHLSKGELGYEQFNEILLLLGKRRVERPFFEFFFLVKNGKRRRKSLKSRSTIDQKILKEGMTRFRGYAMLCCGNFKYPFKTWSKIKDWKEFLKMLGPYCCWLHEKENFEKRSVPAVDLTLIEEDNTWCTGYLLERNLDKDLAMLAALASKQDWGDEYIKELKLKPKQKNMMKEILQSGGLDSEKWSERIDGAGKELAQIRDTFGEKREKAIENLKKYLTWDYMDVYFATSMREYWEFVSASKFINRVMRMKEIKKLNLRYFDPTQSYSDDKIDKGLVEGLMLKRARCTVYLAQETETLGKDAELAATLAQGKPVIAYVPSIDEDELFNRIKEYPLIYILKRSLALESMEILSSKNKSFKNKLSQKTQNVITALDDFEKFKEELKVFQEEKRTFNLLKSEEITFVKNHKEAHEIACKILSVAERMYWDRRAEVLKDIHPLGIQVNLENGVANGVLVVRNPEKCAEILEAFFGGRLKFEIVNDRQLRPDEKPRQCRELIELISGSTFRVVTKNRILTNAFWNFYFS